MAVSPPNASSAQAYEVWLAIAQPSGGPGYTSWEDSVDNGFASMDVLYSV
ncbi:hypothetical protein JXJ21_00365 [candidate division KSB1 bacterium]|nr:hypothetical protein [candidate division KSB1 bacterium]